VRESGRRKKEEGRRKKEEAFLFFSEPKRINLITTSGKGWKKICPAQNINFPNTIVNRIPRNSSQ